jgi:hypothetical protein
MFIEENENGLVYMRSDAIGARHVFTTRYGGVSEGMFSSLNLGANRGDDPEAVRENYRRLCALMGVGIDGMAVTMQVHGNAVRRVTEADRHVCMSAVPYEADGIVTNVKGLPLLCMVADCVPVLLWDGENQVIGAIHCGWRSSVGDILKNALEQMEALGAKARSVHAAIGASIGRCCFETDDDVPEAIEKYLSGETAGLFDRRADGKTMVDLREANARRLVQLGVQRENIDISTECTMCSHDKYWSHRYTHGNRGSQGAAIVL